MNKETLDEFILKIRGKSHGNRWVLEPKFQGLYVRYGDRFINKHLHKDVLDIANVTVEEEYRRTGVFTALITRLRRTYPEMSLYVENASSELKPLLVRMGFIEVPYDSFFMKGDDLKL